MEERKRVLQESSAELEEIFQQSKQISREDLAKACGPLLEAHKKALCKKAALWIVGAIVAAVAVYASGVATLHINAVTRMTLIKVSVNNCVSFL
jgi:hypothetical protein